MALASAANSKLTEHANRLSRAEVLQTKDDLISILAEKKISAVAIPDTVKLNELPKSNSTGTNLAPIDYSSLRPRFDIDRLLVVDLRLLGFERTYASYVPTGAPKAAVSGTGYLVDLSTNQFEWYQPINVRKATDEEWDEPPSFPGLTNADYQAVELMRDQVLEPFRK